MPEICGVCNDVESKYKCPRCQLRYCSISCYRSHKTIHDQEAHSKDDESGEQDLQPRPVDRPGTTQRVPEKDYTGFEVDPDFHRLLSRYPNLKHQLQLVYGLSLEPGPNEANRWNGRDWFPSDQNINALATRGGFQVRGRGSGRGRGRSGGGLIPQDERIRGPWTQEKGGKQGREVLQRMRQSGGGKDELAEGIKEFFELCQMKFGEK